MEELHSEILQIVWSKSSAGFQINWYWRHTNISNIQTFRGVVKRVRAYLWKTTFRGYVWPKTSEFTIKLERLTFTDQKRSGASHSIENRSTASAIDCLFIKRNQFAFADHLANVFMSPRSGRSLSSKWLLRYNCKPYSFFRSVIAWSDWRSRSFAKRSTHLPSCWAAWTHKWSTVVVQKWGQTHGYIWWCQ